ncbi:MAG: universal stress protein [Pseudomonadota bacterium]
MNEIRRILAVIDPTEKEQPALDKALNLARQMQAAVTVLLSAARPQAMVVDGGLAVTFEQYRGDLKIAYEARLNEIVTALRHGNDDVSIDNRFAWHDRLYRGILEQAEETGADLIIKDTHYHSAIARALYTNTDWNLIRHSRVPLWLAKRDVDVAAPGRVVACVDPLQASERPRALDDEIIETARSFAETAGAELHVLHIYQPLSEIGNAAKWAVDPTLLPVDDLSEKIRSRHDEAVARLCDRHDIPADRRHLVAGAVRTLLPGSLTDLKASLTVLGAVSRRNLKRMLVGNTAETILDHAPCDVLVVKRADDT